MRSLFSSFLLALALISSVAAQDESPSTLFNHPERSWSLTGQSNFIFQTNLPFSASYSGPNSFRADRQKAISRVMTLYSGVRITRDLEVIADFETAGGSGLSQALGMAGFTNLDVVRNPSLGSAPYLARAVVHYAHGFTPDRVPADTSPVSLESALPSSRFEVWFGKVSTPDFFDANSVGSDSHMHFMNWVVDNNGAFDYAADTRGYTWGLIAAYTRRNSTLRFGEMLMPTVANGMNLDWNLHRSRSENLEYEHRHRPLGRDGIVRVLGWMNHANMGSYDSAVSNYLAGLTPAPDITAHPPQTRTKVGLGINLEQQVSRDVRGYARLGWNDGRSESFAYTEVDGALSGGFAIAGRRWQRSADRLGVACAYNRISPGHQRYLALGGVGFLLGDGSLNYAIEQIYETYYTARVARGITAGPDLQYVVNPGYNRDRGPVLVPGMRLHFEL